MRSCLLCKFIQPEAMYINLFAILRVFLVGFVGSDLGKQELARICRVYVNARGKNRTVLKLALDCVNLGLCNSRDYFACFCVAYTKCIATLWHDPIYLFICLRESIACHVV